MQVIACYSPWLISPVSSSADRQTDRQTFLHGLSVAVDADENNSCADSRHDDYTSLLTNLADVSLTDSHLSA